MNKNWKWELLWQKRNINIGCGNNKNKGSLKNKKTGTNNIFYSKSLKRKNEKKAKNQRVGVMFLLTLFVHNGVFIFKHLHK
jgi:hypothetical protein